MLLGGIHPPALTSKTGNETAVKLHTKSIHNIYITFIIW